MPDSDVSSIQLLPESFHENDCHRAGVRNGPDRDAKPGGRDRYNKTIGCPHSCETGHRVVTISNSNDPQRWRKRAREMRAIAEEMTVLTRAKESVLRIADQYERRALRAERRLHQDSA